MTLRLISIEDIHLGGQQEKCISDQTPTQAAVILTKCPTCGQNLPRLEQTDLNGRLAGERTIDITSGLYGMQNEIHQFASINLDLSKKRKVTIRGDFTHLPIRDNWAEKVFYDPPHTVDSRNTLLGTLDPQAGLGPHLAAFKYGCYRSIKQLGEAVVAGAAEAYRILEPKGIMVFKWSDSEKPFSWAHDRIMKTGHWEQVDMKLVKSGAQTGNYTSYHWYQKQGVNDPTHTS